MNTGEIIDQYVNTVIKTQRDTVYKLKYTNKTHNCNTKATNIDKTGEKGEVLKDRVIQVTVRGPLSDRRENLSKMNDGIRFCDTAQPQFLHRALANQNTTCALWGYNSRTNLNGDPKLQHFGCLSWCDEVMYCRKTFAALLFKTRSDITVFERRYSISWYRATSVPPQRTCEYTYRRRYSFHRSITCGPNGDLIHVDFLPWVCLSVRSTRSPSSALREFFSNQLFVLAEELTITYLVSCQLLGTCSREDRPMLALLADLRFAILS